MSSLSKPPKEEPKNYPVLRSLRSVSDMDEEDEIQSSPSLETGSPSSPPQNGRITVTVAAAPPPNPVPSQNTLTLALPIQTGTSGAAVSGSGASGSGGGGGGGGREDCWSEGATAVLIDAWGERYLELSRGNLKQKHWKEVAEIVSARDDYMKTPKTDIQCKNRIDTVKKKYKQEKAKMLSGGAPSKWQFFTRLDHLIGPTSKAPAAAPPSHASLLSLPPLPGLKVPTGIPVGPRSFHHYPNRQNNMHKFSQGSHEFKQKMTFRRQDLSSDDDSEDSLPPQTVKRPRRELNSNPVPAGVGKERNEGRAGSSSKGWGSSMRELTDAIVKFGEAYEQAENSKLQQLIEMEKQRMKFAKDLELQRMQFFMKTQLEISQLKHSGNGRRIKINNSSHHLSSNNISNSNNNVNDNNSDSSN